MTPALPSPDEPYAPAEAPSGPRFDAFLLLAWLAALGFSGSVWAGIFYLLTRA